MGPSTGNNRFDEITREFRAAASRDRLSEQITDLVVGLHRGPVSATVALTTWRRWLRATPDDLIAELTLKDLRNLFQQSVVDLASSQKALDNIAKIILDSSNLLTFTQASLRADFLSFRSYIADGLKKGADTRESLLCTLDTPLRLAEHGLLQELFVETFRRSGEAFAEQTALLDDVSHRGLAGLIRLTDGAMEAKGLGRAILWHVGGTGVAAAVAIGGGAAGSVFVAAGCGLAAAAYCGYCLSEYL